ncbi:MAG TPA: Nif3-like dinuclear metal center hexameric protein [Puia sp.]|nr:Nif3-like dinuclear metal center hexameric protein [Puia sp.]
MQIATLLAHLESVAPLAYQENYDNAGLLTGSGSWECTGALVTLDATEAVVQEAVLRKCNLIVAHHPIIFGGLKKITGINYVERTIISAIKQDIAIYAIHTNLDNVQGGVNGRMARQLGLVNCRPLQAKGATLQKLFTFVPPAHLEAVRNAIFSAGAGHIGQYSECSFTTGGEGTFKGGTGTHPFVGEPGLRQDEKEVRLEVILPAHLRTTVIAALIRAHPYEEVAYDLMPISNEHPGVGAGLVGDLPERMEESEFLSRIRQAFGLQAIRHTALTGRPVKKCAVCGGAGSFLISKALAVGADFYITADVKYHEFFDADGRLVIADIGHFESEQFTIDLLFDILREKFPNFAVLKSDTKTNPVNFYS